MSGPATNQYADQIGRDQLISDDIAAAQSLFSSPFEATDGDDFIIGTTIDDEIRGRDGNDTLVDNHGDDTLRGDSGDDDLIGNELVFDAVAGGNGRLLGGAGSGDPRGGNV